MVERTLLDPLDLALAEGLWFCLQLLLLLLLASLDLLFHQSTLIVVLLLVMSSSWFGVVFLLASSARRWRVHRCVTPFHDDVLCRVAVTALHEHYFTSSSSATFELFILLQLLVRAARLHCFLIEL